MFTYEVLFITLAPTWARSKRRFDSHEDAQRAADQSRLTFEIYGIQDVRVIKIEP